MEKSSPGGDYPDFLKLAWGWGLFLGHSLIIIEWTWGFLSQKFYIWHPSPCPPTITHKRVLRKGVVKTSKRHQGFSTFPCFQCFCFFDVFVNFEQISHLVLEYILLVWTGKYPPSIFWFVHLFEFILLAFLL